MSDFTLLDEAANTMADVAGELEAAAALVGQRERTRKPSESASAEAVVLTVREAQGFAQILDLIAGQLRQAEEELRRSMLEEAV